MADNTNPWADAANQAVGALYKYYMTKPNANQIQQEQMKNRLIAARYNTELANQRKLGLESSGLEMRNAAPKQMSELISGYLKEKPVDAPMNVRNNNPLNLRPIGKTEGFQTFDSPKEGLEAGRRDLLAKINGNSSAMAAKFGDAYQPTLANVINTWAPPNENNTNQYLDFVSQKTGYSPDTILNADHLDQLIRAMVQMEGGQPAVDYYYGDSPPVNQQYVDYVPQMMQTAMEAAILNPAQAADVLQMAAGAAQFPPDLFANIQSGAGVDYAKTKEGFNQELATGDTYKPELVQFILDDGSMVPGSFVNGRYYNANNEPMDMTNVSSVAGKSTAQGSLDDITPSNKMKLQDALHANDQVKYYTGRLRQLVDPTVIGASGDIRQILAGASEQGQALSAFMNQLAGENAKYAQEVGAEFNSFVPQGIQGADVASKIDYLALQLSYAEARAADPGGKVSDADQRVQERAIQIAKYLTSVQSINAVLDEIDAKADFNIKNLNSRMGVSPVQNQPEQETVIDFSELPE